MRDYRKGKIYRLISQHTNKIYIGSTIQKLSSRMSALKRQYGWKEGNKDFFEILCYDDCGIVLVEEYPCDSIDQLHMREQYWKDHFKGLRYS